MDEEERKMLRDIEKKIDIILRQLQQLTDRISKMNLRNN